MFFSRLKDFTFVLFPILITQLGMFSMSFLDTAMSGQVGESNLAGVAIGSSLWMPIYTGLSGILMAITPIVAQSFGANDKKNITHTVRQGFYVSVIIAILVGIIGFILLDPILNGMNLEPNVFHIAFWYLVAIGTGLIPLFLYQVLRSFIDGLGKTKVTMAIVLLSIPINFTFNYLLIFGKLGFPKLGGIGSGVATSITYWFILIFAIIFIQKSSQFKIFTIFSKLEKAEFTKWKEILKLGVPIGLAIFFETSIFAAVTLLMSSYSTTTIAAHQVAMNFASFLYMIPLSISMALTVLVGQRIGANQLREARIMSWFGITLAVGFSICSSIFIYFYREQVAAIYSSDLAVIKLSGHFLIFALFFQISDAIQAPVQGALRAYKDVNTSFIMSMISYWVIGLPLGFVLANYTDFGPYGYWIGLITGLAVGAITLSCRLYLLQKKKARTGLTSK